MLADLGHELVVIGQGGQGVGIGFAQKFDTSRCGQSPETVEHFRRIGPELFDRDAGHGETDFELPVELLDQFQQQVIHRQVTTASDLLENRSIGLVVEIIVVFTHIEKTVLLQSQWLMYLKV